ncbi:MAG: hypothetical protein ACKV19_03110 [Verrucomicrobiales bacterium]
MRIIDRVPRAWLALGAVCFVLTVFSAVWLVRADDRPLDQIPKRKAQGRELRLEHHMALGFHRAAWAGLVVGLAGLATAGLWGRRGSQAVACGSSGAEGKPGGSSEAGVLPYGWVHPVRWREMATIVLVATVVSGVLRWPRLGHSFWSDEAYAARAYVWGFKQPQPDGTLLFKPVIWTEALFLNERANNQVWCSIEARVSHTLWRWVSGAPADIFSERVLRMPAFLWGLLSVGALTVLGMMVAARPGMLAGLLLAVHPWHVRFGAEMRGYSAMLLALILGMIFLLLALRDGRWRWWVLAAAANLWALLAFAGSLYVPLVGSGAAAACLIWRRRWDWLARLVLANALAAVVFLWIYGPSITQLKAYLERGSDVAAYTVNLPWLKQFGESLCLGVPWSVMGPTWQEATWLPSASAATVAVTVVALYFLVQIGILARYRPRQLVIPGLLALAAALSIGQSMAAGTILLMWYLLPILIGWVLVIGGVVPMRVLEIWESNPKKDDFWIDWTWGERIGWTAFVLCLAIWTGSSLAMRRVPRQPMREAALQSTDGRPVWAHWLELRNAEPKPTITARGMNLLELDEATRSAMLAVVGVSDGQMKLYAPEVMTVKTLEDLEKAEAQALTAGRKLWISVGGWEASSERSADVIARLVGGGYEQVADLPGWEPMFSYTVWRQR